MVEFSLTLLRYEDTLCRCDTPTGHGGGGERREKGGRVREGEGEGEGRGGGRGRGIMKISDSLYTHVYTCMLNSH